MGRVGGAGSHLLLLAITAHALVHPDTLRVAHTAR